MTRYWVISPYNPAEPEVFEKAWEYDLANGTIAVGWRKLGDISKMEKAELAIQGGLWKCSTEQDHRGRERALGVLWRSIMRSPPGTS